MNFLRDVIGPLVLSCFCVFFTFHVGEISKNPSLFSKFLEFMLAVGIINAYWGIKNLPYTKKRGKILRCVNIVGVIFSLVSTFSCLYLLFA